MARVKATELTPLKLNTHLKLDGGLSDWKKDTTEFISSIKKWNSSITSMLGRNISYEQLNILSLVGNLLSNDILTVRSIFEKDFSSKMSKDFKATSINPEPLDFLGFFSSPKLEDDTNNERVKRSFKEVLDGVVKTNKNLETYLTSDAIDKYVSQTNPIELEDSGNNKDIISILFYISSQGKVPTNSYLTSLIRILSKVKNFNTATKVNSEGIDALSTIFKLNGAFKSNDFLSILTTEVAPFMSNNSDIWEKTDFIENSTENIIENFFRSRNMRQIIQDKRFSWHIYPQQINITSWGKGNLFSFAKILVFLKYLELYLSLGFSKLFGTSKSSDSEKTKTDSDGYVTVNGKRFFDVKNATPEQIKKYQEQNKKEDKTIDNKSSDNEKTNSNKNSNTVSQSSDKDKTIIRQLQNDIFIANSIIKTGKVPEEIPKLFNDGIVGSETKKLFKEFKENIKTLKDEEKPEGVEQNDNFGEYEKLAAKKIIDSYKEQSSAITGIVSGKPEMKDFLGVEGNDVANNFSEYIIQELINTKNDEVAWKLTNLFKTQFERSPSNEELDRAIQWIQKIKNERGADAWKISDHPQSNLA